MLTYILQSLSLGGNFVSKHRVASTIANNTTTSSSMTKMVGIEKSVDACTEREDKG